MPRPLRLEYEGAWYHVMNRGANHQLIYLNDEQKIIFLSLLECMAKKFYIEVHAYCLMDNHYHLLLRTPIANLSKGMRYLDGVYTQKFNYLQNRDGPLFRGRYRSIVVDADTYLLQVSKYIHLNPVAARICDFPHEYKWSSYRYYNEEVSRPSWLQTNMILNNVGGESKYAAYMLENLDENFYRRYNQKYLPSIIGTKQFIDEKLATIKPGARPFFLTDINRTIHLLSIDTIINKIAVHFKIEPEKLKEVSRGKRNDIRMLAIYLSRQVAQMTHQKIAEYFLLNRRSIGTIIARSEERIEKDENFRKLFRLLEVLINS